MEADSLGLLTEALTADVEAVLADDTALVTANSAVKKSRTSGDESAAEPLRSRLTESFPSVPCIIPIVHPT